MWHSFASLARTSPSRPRPARRRRATRPGLEGLEGRVVLSASFDSVLTVGSDTVSIAPADIAVDASGNTYVTGMLLGRMDFDPASDRPDGADALTPLGTSDAYVVKYAADNSLVWARRMGGGDTSPLMGTGAYDRGQGVRVDAAGNVYVTGNFRGQADFGPVRLTSAGDCDAFVVKLDSNGNTVWARGWGGADQDQGYDLAVDAAGNVIAVGSAAYPNGTGGWVENTSLVRKYSPTGQLAWAQSFAGPTNAAYGVTTDAAGNAYVCGKFSGTVDFNPDRKLVNSVSGNYGSAYVLKLTAAGAYGRVSAFATDRTLDPNAYVELSDIALDGAGNVVVGGYYQGQVDLDPSPTVTYRPPTPRGINGFVAKLSAGGSLVWARQTGGDFVKAVALDASGAIYAAGNFYAAQGFTPGSGLPAAASNGGSDAYVTRFTASGTQEWAWTFGGAGSDSCSSLAVVASGSIYLAGTFGPGTVDFDPDPLTPQERTNTSSTDLFLLKLRQS
jgi:hypothetical protein